jgi:hypothetical protein
MDVTAPDFPVRESFRAMNCPALPTDAITIPSLLVSAGAHWFAPRHQASGGQR